MTDTPDTPEEDPTVSGATMLADLGFDSIEDPEEAAAAPEEEFAPIQVEIPEVKLESPPDFAVPRQVLVDMLARVMEVIPARDQLPALKNVVIEVTPDSLTLTGSDSMSTVITKTTAVRVKKPGRVLMRAAKLSNVVKRTAGAEVSMRADGQMLHVDSGPTMRSLRVDPIQKYVTLSQLDDLEWHAVDRTQFVRAVHATRFAASNDDEDLARQQLYFSDGSVAATDTRCFAQASGLLPQELSCEMSTAAVDLIVKLLDRNDAKDFRIANTSHHIVAEIGPIDTCDRIIVGHVSDAFPTESLNAVQVPLSANRDVLRIPGEALLEALRRAVPTSDEDTGAVGLRVGVPDADSVTIATRNRSGELSTEVIPADFSRPGSDNPPKPRTVLLSHTRLASAIRAVSALAPEDADEEMEDSVVLRLGEDQTQAKRAFVLMENASQEAGQVRIVLSQVRSTWLEQ